MLRVLEFFLVREYERKSLQYFLLLFLIIGCGTAIGRGTADALFFKRYGIEYLPIMFLLLGMMLMVVSIGYAAFADRLPAERFFRVLCAVLAVLLVGNLALIHFTRWEHVYPLYFLIYEVASELILVHAGLYVSQNFDSQQTKRLLPLILAGTQSGYILGGLLLSLLAPLIGVQNMLLVWAMLSTVAVFMMRRHHDRVGTSAYFRSGIRSARRMRQAWEEIVQGLRFARRSPLLQAISLGLFFTVIAFYILGYAVNRLYTQTFASEAELAAFFGILTAVTGVCALLLQLFFTSRALARFGIKPMNMVFPFSLLLGFGGLLLSFTLPFAVLASVVKDVVNPAIRNPVSSLFFQALPGYMEGRARAMSVALVTPCALAVAGGLLWLAQQYSSVDYFLLLGLSATMGYVILSWRMNHAYVGSILHYLRSKLFVPGEVAQRAAWGGAAAKSQLVQTLHNSDENYVRIAADSLVTTFGSQALPPILKRIGGVGETTADYLVRLITPYVDPSFAALLRQYLPESSPRLRATLILALARMPSQEDSDTVTQALAATNPRLNAAAIHWVLCQENTAQRHQAIRILRELAGNRGLAGKFAAAEVLQWHPLAEFTGNLRSMLDIADSRLQVKVLQALACQQALPLEFKPDLLALAEPVADVQVRIAVMRCLKLFPVSGRNDLMILGLQDHHPLVRRQAMEVLVDDGRNRIDLLASLLQDAPLNASAQQTIARCIVDLEAPTPVLEVLAEFQARQAQDFLHALEVVSSNPYAGNDYWELVSLVLEERVAQAADRALILLEPIEGRERIGTVRAALQSNDARLRAGAGEVVRHFTNPKLAALLRDIIEHRQRPSSTAGSRYNPVRKLHSIEDVIIWCRAGRDPWLAQCAQQAAEIMV